MDPGKQKKTSVKRTCGCGCERKVTARTEYNHLNGRSAGPLVKAHHAARRLAVLGLSPGRLQQRIQQSPLLSPPGKRRAQAKRAQQTHHTPQMDIGEDLGQVGGTDDDSLPVFFPEAGRAELSDIDNMRMDGPGDRMLASSMMGGEAEDRRDATNVRVRSSFKFTYNVLNPYPSMSCSLTRTPTHPALLPISSL